MKAKNCPKQFLRSKQRGNKSAKITFGTTI